MIGDGREYVSFSIARGTWRLAFVLMMDDEREPPKQSIEFVVVT